MKDDKVISEVVVTGHDDSISRRLRKTPNGIHHLKGDRKDKDGTDKMSIPNPAKSPLPRLGRKSNNNKPKRKRVLIDKNKINESYREAIIFIESHEGKPITRGDLLSVNDKIALQSVVGRMLAYHLGEWRDDGDIITNGSIEVNRNLWEVKHNMLYSKVTGERPTNYDWLYNLRMMLESTIIEDIDSIRERINGRQEQRSDF